MTFANPNFFWLLLIIPLLILWYIFREKKFQGTIKVTSIKSFGNSPLTVFRHSLIVLRCLVIAALIMALARPQTSLSWQDVTTEGIDIIIALDISGSMLAEDFKPNRLEASKEVAMDFISERPFDRIGLVVYGGESFTQCPLTTDHDVLLNLFSDIQNGMIEDGTAIGMGLATAVSRLKDSEAISKVAILLTDGSNNSGAIPPVTAAEIAREFGIRVYTVGVGSNGSARMPMQDQFGRTVYQNVPVRIDETTLKDIAKITDGKYFRATNKNKLESIYQEIDRLEKSKIEVTEYKNKSEKFWPFAFVAALLFLIEFLMKNLIFKGIV
ncbi:MAG: aerotolerance regulator BatA [Flavobacteriales bacterium CG_4_10_14_0_2_um_filter_32_8]|nr:MAG: aerotolerance regulator BatA [Flavobacteriales bacterium CG_4_10_14_0_2_um_filter_32_8]PJB15442.1 MAG: aerotolerance regulator BatA [Flavobacteriales bacterium CG_4_9_14_3_um_filter_32_8]